VGIWVYYRFATKYKNRRKPAVSVVGVFGSLGASIATLAAAYAFTYIVTPWDGGLPLLVRGYILVGSVSLAAHSAAAYIKLLDKLRPSAQRTKSKGKEPGDAGKDAGDEC
jgi:hypothetical protein